MPTTDLDAKLAAKRDRLAQSLRSAARCSFDPTSPSDDRGNSPSSKRGRN